MSKTPMQSQIESLERDLEAKDREIATLKIRLMQAQNMARDIVTQSRALASAAQHHLCCLDGTGRRGE